MNEIELQLIHKLFIDGTLYYKTKVKHFHFTDLLAVTLFNELGKSIINFGGFIPMEHLKALCNDPERMNKYKSSNYPLEINSPSDIINFIHKFKGDVSLATLEKTIIDDYNRRKLTEISEEMMYKLQDSKMSTKEILRTYSYKLDTIKHDTTETVSFISGQDVVEREIRRINSNEKVEYFETGFSFIDNHIGGITSPATVYFVAPAKQGKSMSLYEGTVHQLREGKNVLFVTIEIPEDECYRKILSNFTQIEYHKIVKNDFTDEERKQYLKGLEDFNKYRDNLFIVYDKTGISPQDIKHYYQNLEKVGIKCDFIMIDYLGLLNSDEGDTSEVDKMMKLPKQLRTLSQETNSIIFCPQQMKTSAYKNNIEDISANDVFYAKTLTMEGTLGYFMLRDKETGHLLIKNFFSRIGEMSDTYYFPNKNLNKCTLGLAEIYDKVEF